MQMTLRALNTCILRHEDVNKGNGIVGSSQSRLLKLVLTALVMMMYSQAITLSKKLSN